MLLYGYGAVCLCMLVFNVVYNIVMKGNPKRMERRCRKLSTEVEQQIVRISRGQTADEAHMARLSKKLRRVNNLIALERVMTARTGDRSPAEETAAADYCRQLQPVILRLAEVYQKREPMQAAYFAYFLSKYPVEYNLSGGRIEEILVDYMEKDSLYCRINALQALYQEGSAESVADALVRLDRTGAFFHDKILTDGLLTFQGNHGELIELLWKRFDRFSDQTRLAVVNYIRFKSGDYCEPMLAIMTNRQAYKELRISAIRYFGKYPYKKALAHLLDFARDRDSSHWEYEAVSLSSLASYSGEEVVETLMDAMYSSNWYVRRNAAASLEAMSLEYTDLIRVVSGRDRYAREMMMYQLEERHLKDGDEEEDWL